MIYQRHQAAVQAAKNKTQQDYGLALQLYKTPEPEASQEDLQFLLNEIKLMRLKQTASGLGRVVDLLDRASAKKSNNCGCTGKSASAGRRETKSLSNGSTRQSRNYFAEHLGQICREQYMDAEYMSFCEAYL